MSALRVPSDPDSGSLTELRTAVSVAYEQVQLARRCLANLAPSAELTSFLQAAEADLVRALVAAGELDRTARYEQSIDRLISISQRRATHSQSA